MAVPARPGTVIGAVNLGSYRISAMIAAVSEAGALNVLGTSYRASQGIRRGFITDQAAATYAVRDAIEKAERMAREQVSNVWVGISGAGLTSEIRPIEIALDGRRIEPGDLDVLLRHAQAMIEPDGHTVLHAQMAGYALDGADGVANPVGLHAQRLGMNVHVMLAEGAPVRNLVEAVQSAHLGVIGVVASPLAACQACLSAEERDLGVALVEMGGELTHVSVHSGGLLTGLATIRRGSADMTDAIATHFGIRRFQAERVKCRFGSARATAADNRELIPLLGPGEQPAGSVARGADDQGRVPRAALIAVIESELEALMGEIAGALARLGFGPARPGGRAGQVVLTGGGAELPGLADYAQGVLATPVRIARAPALPGLLEAHSNAGFATLAGIVMHAAADPADIRRMRPRQVDVYRLGPLARFWRLFETMRREF